MGNLSKQSQKLNTKTPVSSTGKPVVVKIKDSAGVSAGVSGGVSGGGGAASPGSSSTQKAYQPTGDPRVDVANQANIAAGEAYARASQSQYVATSQKQRALESGGRYAEGGAIYTVRQQQASDSRTNEERNAQFSQLNEQARSKMKREETSLDSYDEGPVQKQENYLTWDEGGTTTFTEKKSFSRESRQDIKNFLSQNKSESYNIYDQQGRLIKTTSGRDAYPDILKAALVGQVSVSGTTTTNQKNIFSREERQKVKDYIKSSGVKVFSLYDTKGNLIKTTSGRNAYPDILKTGLSGGSYGTATEAERLIGPPQRSDIKRSTIMLIRPAVLPPPKNETRIDSLLGKNISVERVYNQAVPFLSGLVQNTAVLAASFGVAVQPVAKYGTLTSFEKGSREAIKFYEQNKAPAYPSGSRADIQQKTGEIAGVTGGVGLLQKGASLALGKVAQTAESYITVRQATKDFAGILAPKQVVSAKINQKISVKPATGLSKTIGGPTLITSKLTFKPIGGDLVLVESESLKQGKAIIYNVKDKKIFAIEGTTEGSKLPESFNLRGPLSNIVTQQVAQQKKFGLTQIDKDLYASGGKEGQIKGGIKINIGEMSEASKVNLIKAIESKSSVAHIGNVKTFSLSQAKSQPIEFGRFLFGKDPLPTKPISDLGLLESVGFRTGGTKIPSSSKGNVFEPFKEGKVKSYTTSKPEGAIKFLTTTKHLETTFTKKLPTTSYVTDVQKNIRFIDPFSKSASKSSRYGNIDLKIDKSMLGATDEGFGKYPTGKPKPILTKTKEDRDVLTELFKKEKQEQDILFSKPRFDQAYGLVGAGSVLITSEYQNPNVPPSLRMIESPQIGKSESNSRLDFLGVNTRSKKETQKDSIFGTVVNIIPKSQQDNKLFQSIIPITSPKTFKGTTPGLMPKLSIDIIPITTPTTTPIITSRLDIITTPDLKIELTPELFTPGKPVVPTEELFPPIIPEGFFGGPLSSRGGGGSSALLGETADFVGNVPSTGLYQLEGIFGKKQEITYRSSGFRLPKEKTKRQTKGSRLVFNVLGKQQTYKPVNLSSLYDTPKKSKRSKKTKSINTINLGFLGGNSNSKSSSLFGGGKSKSMNIFGKGKRVKIF